MKTYFKGTSGIQNPVDINGAIIKAGSILTRDYADYEKYMHKPHPINYETNPFYLVKEHISGKGLYAESIEIIKDHSMPNARFYLHDFRFKNCKIISI
jgi:hypothetical protein